MAIAPGLFDTGISAGFSPELISELERSILNPPRLGDPREFAALVAQIIENPYLNATTISLDGGARMV